MAPRCLLYIIAITISIGVSPIFTWNPDIHRYESYDLEKGPVFYEAYYPDSNEESRPSYQEKRYFDQEPVLEKTYQVPSSERVPYPETNVRLNNYQTRALDLLQNDDRFAVETKPESLDIKEISNLARRAISRDLENWNTLENYLDRAKYQDPSLYRRRIVVPESGYRIEQPVREIESSLTDPVKQQRDLRRDLYEEVREEPLALPSRVQLNEDQRDPIRRLAARDLSRDLGPFRSIRYVENRALREPQRRTAVRNGPLILPSLKDSDSEGRTIIDAYPTENIFAPRPQVINYIFSKKPEATAEKKMETPELADLQSVQSEIKETMSDEPIPRSYGDNLIRDEIKKSEESKDVKVTSIEVSEVPKHKTRHHHGELPKRDYSRRHQP